MIRKFNNEKLYEYQTAINKIKEMYGKDFLVFNNSKEAKAYFDKYSYIVLLDYIEIVGIDFKFYTYYM